MADTKTLILQFQADTEIARAQLLGLVGTLGDTATQVDQRLARIEDSFARTNKGISTKSLALATTIGSAFGTIIGNAIGRLPGQLIDIAQSAVESASSIKNTADALGIGTDALQNFRIGATKAGVETAGADKALEKFVGTIGRAAGGNKAATASFTDIGVSLKDADGNLKPFSTLLNDVFDGIAKLPDPARQAAAAVKLFGENGDALLPFLRGGSQGINDLAAASDALGLKLSPETINKLDELGNKAADIKAVITAQLAAAVGQNADAFLALGRAAESAIAGVGGLLLQMRGIKALVDRGDFVSAISLSGDSLAKLGSARGLADFDAKKLADARAAGKNPVTIDDYASRAAESRQDLLNELFPINSPRAPGRAGGAVVDPVAKPGRTARPARTAKGYDPAKDLAGVLDGPGAALGFLETSKEAERAIAQLDGSAKTLGDTLRGAFDKSSLDELVQTLPNLNTGLNSATQLGNDLLNSLLDSIDAGNSLGDALVNAFIRAGIELFKSGLLKAFQLSGEGQGSSGGGGGSDYGSLANAVASIFGGGFADGGSPPLGKISVVGERGPELFIPKVPGTIIPNGSFGGNTTIVNDLRGSIVETELYNRINQSAAQAAQAGAIGGKALAAQDRARQTRRSLAR